MARRTMAVIGGGVTGLVAARRLVRDGHDVAVFEAGNRLGGQIWTVDMLGHRVDVGAESLHLAGPAITTLVDELGLGAEVVTAESSFAWLWDGHRRRRLPAGVGPAGPTRLAPVVKARVLSPLGMARAALEPLVPSNTDWNQEGHDVPVGPFIARRFGRQVADRLVDPVLGSLHAGDVDRLSMRAATPMLAARAARTRSLLLGTPSGSGGAPAFASFRGGLASMVARILDDTGVRVHLDTAVREVVPDGTGYELRGDSEVLGSFDGVLVALPAARAGAVLEPLCSPASRELSSLRTASVATVVVAYRRRDVEGHPALESTGVLSSSTTGSLFKAATFLSTKWPHLRNDDHVLIRLSAGRVGDSRLAELDDDAVVNQLLVELEQATGLADEPELTRVQRWPNAIPQLEVGHLDRLSDIRSALASHPGLHLAGAAYTGLGIATCVAAGTRAAEELSGQLVTPSEVTT